MQYASARFSLTGFVACPMDELATAIAIDRERIDDLYRQAYERARESQRPSITDRLAPIWN